MPRRGAGAGRAAGYRSVFAVREYRYLFTGQVLSQVGDQAMRVALALLVFRETGSSLLTALAYALTFLPWVLGGPLLGRYADQLPRRTVLISCDIARAGLIGLAAVQRMPVGVVLAAICLASFLTPAFDAARSALLPDILEGDRYTVGLSLSQIVSQTAQVVGFVGGGVLVSAVSARGALLVDALTFVLSALLLAAGLRQPFEPPGAQVVGSFWHDTREGMRAVLGTPQPRTLILLAWAGVAAGLAPEALAAPYAENVLHGGGPTVGWLMAAQPVGMVVGLVVVGRLLPPPVRRQVMAPLAVAMTLPLCVFALRPGLPATLTLLVVSGFAMTYQLPLQAAFALVVPAEVRGRAFGVAASGLQVAQGLGVVTAGGIALALHSSAAAIAISGIVGTAVLLALVTSPHATLPVPVEEVAPAVEVPRQVIDLTEGAEATARA